MADFRWHLTDWRDGWQAPIGAPLGVPSTALLVAENIDYVQENPQAPVRVRARRGRTSIADFNTIIGGGADLTVSDVWRHYPRTGSNATLVWVKNATAARRVLYHSVGGGAFSQPTGAFNAAEGADWFFVNWADRDRTFLANGSNGLYSYNGVLSAVTQTPVQTNGPYVAVYASRLVSTVLADINRFVYLSDPSNESLVQGTNVFLFDDPEGGKIRGVVSLQDRLVVIRDGSVWTRMGTPTTPGLNARVSEVGSQFPLSIVSTPWGIILVSVEGIRVWTPDQLLTQDITGPLQQFFTPLLGNPTLNFASEGVFAHRGAYYPRRQQFWFGHGGNTYILTRLPGGGGALWSKYTGAEIAAATAFTGVGDMGSLVGGVRAGADKGFLVQFDDGTTDRGAAITHTIQTPFLPIAQGASRKGRVHEIEVEYYGKVPLTVGIRYDGSAVDNVTAFALGSTLGSNAIQTARALINDWSATGSTWSVRLSWTGNAGESEIHRISVNTRAHGWRLWA
jgi:hypothetical protein